MDVMPLNTRRTACFGHTLNPSGNNDSAAAVVLWQLGLNCFPCSYGPNIINHDQVSGFSVCVVESDKLENAHKYLFRLSYTKISSDKQMINLIKYRTAMRSNLKIIYNFARTLSLQCYIM